MADASLKSNALPRWQFWRKPKAEPEVQPSASEAPPPMLTVIEGVRYVLGLEWRLIPPTRSLQRTLSLARKEDKKQYVLTEMQDIIGFCGPLPQKWGKTYSAALHLAARMSQGGLELYAFELTNGQCMVVALNESKPIPGFDFVGDPAVGRGLVDEFMAIEQGQPIRFVGNAGWLEGEETVYLEDIFANPARSACLKRLMAANAVKWMAGGTVARAKADGYTLLYSNASFVAVAPAVLKTMSYDPVKDLSPITMGVNFPNVLVVGAQTGIKTFADFVAYAKKNPGKLDFASTGPGSASHLAGELLNDMAKIDTVHVPYKGGAPALQDLLGGRVASYYSTLATAQPHIESGALIPLASTGLKRLPKLPNIPTIAESGYPGFSATNWYAFVASSKVPAPLLDRWNAELVKVLKSPDVVEQLNGHGLTPQPGTRDELAKTIASETATWGRIIRERKITAE